MNNFFKSETDRMLWIKLNAERIHFNHDSTELGNINEAYTPMNISRNQLVYDETNCSEPRFSLEELLLCSQNELERLNAKRNMETIEMLNNFEISDFKL